MSASSEVRRIIVRTGMLIAGIFVLAVLLSAMPGRRVPVVDAQSEQQNSSQQNSSAGQSMQGMDHSKMMTPDADEQASERDAMEDMGHMHGSNPHMAMTAMRMQTSADVQKANEIVAQLKNGIEKYRDYHVALNDGFRIFMPNVLQPEYHFTNYNNGFLPALQEDRRRLRTCRCDVHHAEARYARATGSARSAQHRDVALAHESLPAAAIRIEECRLDEIRSQGFHRLAGSVRRRGRPFPPFHLRLDGPRLPLRILARQSLCHASPRLSTAEGEPPLSASFFLLTASNELTCVAASGTVFVRRASNGVLGLLSRGSHFLALSGSIAPPYPGRYHCQPMLSGLVVSQQVARIFAVLALAAFLLAGGDFPSLAQTQSNEFLPLDQVKPGMQGYAYTIFAGDQVEKFDLEVLGVMPNFLGPKQSIILVQLKGQKVEHTGVVAGMSGSPVYLDGKLAGALSLKLGAFTKEPIAGVTPIADVISGGSFNSPSNAVSNAPLPMEAALRAGIQNGAALQSIETPLVFSGFQPAAIEKFAPQLSSYGFVAAQGGTTPARPDDAKLSPGDMAGMVLVQGDASINSACTVTAVQNDKVFLCGHPFLSLGDVQMPMARSRVVTTLSSDLASTKIVNVGGSIGTITGDHLTAVTGKLGAAPAMVPLDLTLVTAEAGSAKQKTLHFELVN